MIMLEKKLMRRGILINKSYRRSKMLKAHTAIALSVGLPIISVIFSDASYAGSCTIPVGSITSGDTSVCTGDFIDDSYPVPGVQDVTVINNGNWIATGDLSNNSQSIFGPANNLINYTGLHMINNENLTWNDATVSTPGNVLDKTISVMGGYYKTQSNGSTYINNGSINGSTGNEVLSSFNGIANIGRSGILFSENTGNIVIDVTNNQYSSIYGTGMTSFGGAKVNMINSGDISVNIGSHYGAGIDYTTRRNSYPEYLTGSININNSGNILTTSGSGQADGVAFYIYDIITDVLLNDAKLINTGRIEASSTLGMAHGVYIESNVAGVPIEIINENEIFGSNHSIYAHSATASPIHILNTGLLSGAIQTSNGADIYTQTDGMLDGHIGLGAGNDQFNWSGGKFTGALDAGDGSDNALIASSDYDGTQVFDGGDGVSTSDGMVDAITFSGVSATTSGSNIRNWENIFIENTSLGISDGALVTGSDPDTGLTLRAGGALEAGAFIALTGNMDVEAGGSFVAAGNGSGLFTISGTVKNAGLISLADDLASGDKMRVAGLYTGAGGIIGLNTTLGDDSSATDIVFLDGGSDGSSFIRVKNATGAGAQTNEGIKIIDVTGSSAGIFSLLGDYVFEGDQAVVGGAYAYRLYQGATSEPNDGNWYLRSSLMPDDPDDPLYQSGVPIYESYAQSLLGLNGLSTLQQRVGNRYWAGNGNRVISQGADTIQHYVPAEEAGVHIDNNGIWGRIEGAHNKVDPRRSTSGADYSQNVFRMQAGVDMLVSENTDGMLIGGVFAHYVHGKTKVRSIHGDGEIASDGYGFGGSLTWYGDEGFYVDGQAQVTWYDSNLSSSLAHTSLVSGNKGFGYALSLETGKRFAITPEWSVTPQAQLTYSNVRFDSFHDVWGAHVSLDRGSSLQGRLGMTLDHESSWQNAAGLTDRAHVYGIANLYYGFSEGTKVNVASEQFTQEQERLWGGLGIGGSYNWNDDKYSFYGEGLVNTSLSSFGDSYTLKGNIGFRVKW